MKKQYFLLSLFLMLFALPATAQIINNIELSTSINDDGAAPDASAKLEVQSTNKGILIPRMTTAQRTAINSPATGLLVFDTSTAGFWFYNGSAWADLSAGSSADTDWTNHANGIYNNTDNVAIGTTPNANFNLYSFRDNADTGANKANIYAYRHGTSGVANGGGTGWNTYGVDAGIKAFSNFGNNYSAAIYGSSFLDFPISAAVLGANDDASTYGALGFNDANSKIWAGYFEGDININGNLTMDDGNQAAGKVLTSDANGQATWQNAPSDGHWIDDANGIYNDTDNVAIGITPNTNYNFYSYRGTGDIGADKANIHGFRSGVNDFTSGGTSWHKTDVDVAIRGDVLWGNSYSAAVYGSSYLDFENSAAVLGNNGIGDTYGALGYKDGNSDIWAGYFEGDVKVNGSLTLEDGTEVAGKVLTSDANGQASWQIAPSDGHWTDHAEGIYNVTDYVAIGATPDVNYNLYSHRPAGDIGANKASIYGLRLGSGVGSSGGTDWTNTGVDAAIKGKSSWGNNYSAAIYGNSSLEFANSAAVLGANWDGLTYGALGYKDGSSYLYAGYFKGEVFVKQNASGAGINFENHDSFSETWRLGISSFTNNLLFYYNGTIKSYIDQSDGAYIQGSDRSLKTDIEYLEGVLPKVMALKPAKYNYKSSIDAPQKSHGFIAQEVQAIFPELVRKSEDGTLALAYDDFAIISVQAIKEQQQIIDDLKADKEAQEMINQIQEEKNTELEKRMAKLEALLLNEK